MDWKRRNSIQNLVNGILEFNVLGKPPIELIGDIMKKRNIIFEERDENDSEFCGIYIEINDTKIIFVNSNMYEPRKNFTIAHELGHHYLGHTLTEGAIVCDKSALDASNKERPEAEKEADYFASCLLMPKDLIVQKKKIFEKNNNDYSDDALVDYLKDFFKVSKEALGYRLTELNIDMN